MSNMIYEFKTHSLQDNIQNITTPKFSLTIATLEIVFELKTGKLIGVEGYFPLVKAIICSIDIPQFERREYVLQNVDLMTFKSGGVYDLIQRIPQTRKYFGNVPLKYDKEKGIIQIGHEIRKGDVGIKVNDNILCGLDKNLDLKCVYIIPTKFV